MPEVTDPTTPSGPGTSGKPTAGTGDATGRNPVGGRGDEPGGAKSADVRQQGDKEPQPVASATAESVAHSPALGSPGTDAPLAQEVDPVAEKGETNVEAIGQHPPVPYTEPDVGMESDETLSRRPEPDPRD